MISSNENLFEHFPHALLKSYNLIGQEKSYDHLKNL